MLILFFFPMVAQAGQLVAIINNGEAAAQISRVGLSRIYVQEDHITQITSLNGELIIQKDLENGQLFVKPVNEGRDKPIDVFISTEKGNHFALSLKPAGVHSQNIGLYIKDEKAKQREEELKLLSFVKELQQKELKLDRANENLGEMASNLPYQAIKTATVDEGKYLGEVYLVENNHRKAVKLDKTAFWEEDVKAVAIEKEHLLAGEATKVLVVRSHG